MNILLRSLMKKKKNKIKKNKDNKYKNDNIKEILRMIMQQKKKINRKL